MITPKLVEIAAAAIANARGGRRGIPPIENVLDVIPVQLVIEVTEDARAALEAVFDETWKRLENAYLWQNGLVMVFDAAGRQVPELQGPAQTLIDRVLERDCATTKYFVSEWGGTAVPIDRTQFAARCRQAQNGNSTGVRP